MFIHLRSLSGRDEVMTICWHAHVDRTNRGRVRIRMRMRSTPKSLSVNQSNVLNCVCDLARPPFCCVFLPGPWGFLADVWLFVLQLADSYQTINISSIYLPGVAVLYTQAAQSEVFLADVSESFAGFVCCLCRKWSRALGMQSYSCNIRSKLIATERGSCPSL